MKLSGPKTSIVGAIIGFVPNYLMDVRRERSSPRSHWDSALFELCLDFTATARAWQELCLRRAGCRKDAGCRAGRSHRGRRACE
jgi:hypothetical protein